MTRRWQIFLFLAPALFVMLAMTLYPFLFTVRLSFDDWGLTMARPRTFVGLENYLRAFRSPGVWNAARVTAVYVLSSVGIAFVLGLAIAFLLDTQFKGRAFIRAFILLPMVMAPVVAGLIWRFIFNAEWGLANYLATLLGFSSQGWLVTPDLALVAVIIADVWQWTPFIVLVALAGMQAVPRELIEAGEVDGASWWQLQRYVTLPTIRSVLLIGLLIRMIDSFRYIDHIFVMTYGGPGNATSVMGFFTYLQGFKFFEMGYTAALGILLLAVTISLSNIVIRFLRKQ